MLKRIYVNNYKSLVNFEIALGSIELLLGRNGAGKSALFETLHKLRTFISVDAKVDIFEPESCTRWQDVPEQTFELDLDLAGHTYRYVLVVEHDPPRRLQRVLREQLLYDGAKLFSFETGEVQLYRDNFSEGPAYPFDWSQSALATIRARPDNTHLTEFKEAIERILIVMPIPQLMQRLAEAGVEPPSLHMEDFTSWYLHLSKNQGFVLSLTSDLKDVLPGFSHFAFRDFSDRQSKLQVVFSEGRTGIAYDFAELSEGQRMLMALYTILNLARNDRTRPLIACIDEPDNFVALREIQPWLMAMEEAADEFAAQFILISHHPESIDYLLSSPVGRWFERDNGFSPTRVWRMEQISNEDALPASDLIARGWIDARG
ncbi:MAG: AAA family ATPase [Anaerolineae bacterium]|nr:AAA family ATPase [Anaerolineae bacterium]